LVTRRPHPADGRTICLYLTATKESLLDEVSTWHTSLNNLRWSLLSAGLYELLERLQVVKVVRENQLDGNRV
jgi:DNA-binding MarR family transcriptional regulator